MYYLIGLSAILIIICIILIVKLNLKQKLDLKQLEDYTKLENELQDKVNNLKYQKQDLDKDIAVQNSLIKEKNETIKDLNEKVEHAREQYNYEMRDRTNELDNHFNQLKESKQKELNDYYQKINNEKQLETELKYKCSIDYYENLENQARQRADCATGAANRIVDEAFDRAIKALEGAKEEENRFNAILAPIKQYEMEQQQRLYYTIQVPDEYKEDIDFLLNTVSLKVQHPDIINKLVWAEYVKPYLDATFKRVGIEEKPGIYKLTSLIDNKCYIGKSTNIKKRIADHMKSSVGIRSIADQAVHHVILKQGYWNWTIEPIIYCDKEQLSELEKYYINFFQSNTMGYNKTGGGEG